MSARWLLWMAHGPKVFVALALLCAALGAWAGPRLVVAWRSAQRRRRARALGVPRDEVPAGEGIAVVLRGELRADEAIAAVTDRHAPLADGTPVEPRTKVASMLAVTLRNGEVRLPADLEVVVGSVEETPRASAGDEARVLRRLSLRAGDTVVVEGVIEPAGAEAAVRGYRGAAPAWRMVAGAYGRVRVAGVTAVGATGGRAWRAAGAVAGAVLGAGVMAAAAHATLLSAKDRRGAVAVGATRTWCEGGGVTRAVLASASPTERALALDEVALALRCARRRDATMASALDGALRLRGSACMERVVAMEAMGEPGRASDLAMTCGSAEAAVRAAWLRAGLGDFGRASAALVVGRGALRSEAELHRAVSVHALASAWPEAAATARRAAEMAGARRAARDDDPYTRTMWCVADAMAARGGDGAALQRLERRVSLNDAPACRLLRAEIALVRGESVEPWVRVALNDDDDRIRYTGEFGDTPEHEWASRKTPAAAFDTIRFCLDAPVGCGERLVEPIDALSLDVALRARPYESEALRRYRAMPTLNRAQELNAAELSLDFAYASAALGDYPRALEIIRWANDHASVLSIYYDRLATLHAQAWISAAAGDRDAVDAALGELEGAGERAPAAMIPLAVRRWADGDRAGLAGVALASVDDRDAREALTAGRGDILLGWLRRQPGVVPIVGRRAVLAGVVYGVLPRDEARAWLRTEDLWIDPASLIRTWRAAAQRLAIATRVGDRETAAAMRAVVRRHAEAANRRDLAMTMQALDLY